ncbi:MAG: FAD-dependent oxidoreductase [Dehalococcoidia bacterium]|nr:FAD-dependent oxidoreductase [Dehalococcoidia bacterium]
MSDQFKLLFSPLQIGPMTVPNRIVVPGHYPSFNDPDGLPGDRHIAYWESKAKGGVGMICTGVTPVHSSVGAAVMLFPHAVEKMRKAAQAIQKHGTKFLVQLWHGGVSTANDTAGRQAWAPSAISRGAGMVAHEMTRDEIQDVIRGFAMSAAACKKAGCDGIELHGAHNYLICQFMSPLSNHRTDEYGGSLEKRMHFPLELIEAVRNAVGKDFVVGIRFNGDEFQPGGYTIEDMKIMAKMMANTGKLDYLNVSTGYLLTIAPMYFPPGHSVYLAAQIKEVVDIPVCCIGRINDPVQAEKILESHQADLVAMNRATICDPELPRKAKEGRLEEIRKCLACSEGCWQRVSSQHTLGATCAYNPVVGKENIPGWLDLIPTPNPKKVMVIGGGPAGMEAARVAASRGHKVSLWEKGPELGGLLLTAAKAPGRSDLLEVPRYQKHQMKILNVDVHLDTEVTPEMVLEQKPNVVIVATGSFPRKPFDIIGTDQPNVVDVRDVLNETVEVGQNVLIVDSQRFLHGLTVADFLAEKGKTVEVIFSDLEPASDAENITKMALLQRLYNAGVKLTPSTRLKRIEGNTVTVALVYTEAERIIENVDTIVLSFGGVENNKLYYALRGKVPELYSIGDCKGVRKLLWASSDGATIGRMI